MKKNLLAVLICLFSVAQAMEFREVKDISYSDSAEICRLDVKVPVGVTCFATVVNFHGGGLVHGKRCYAPWPSETADRDPIAQVAVTYRLFDENAERNTVSPDQPIDDAASAVAWVLRHIAEFGGDPKKVFVTGVSAGGYLTAMIGLDARWLAKYGFKPENLAGIAPLTGQMTKHFNVRAIGFRDRDRQYAPKIDEWAPIAYAGAEGLPPVCLLTGGRDVEWKSRVEENEFLAVSLLNCGNRSVEFHETEGDHGGGVLESKYFLRDFVAKTCDSGMIARFGEGENVGFLGDSITHGGGFVAYLQLFDCLRNPGRAARITNFGISGDRAGGGIQRFEHDLMAGPPSVRPTRVFRMFGMNDIERQHWATLGPDEKTLAARERAVATYEKNQRRLSDMFAAAEVKEVLMTPTPYDSYSLKVARTDENLLACNEPGLSRLSDIVRQIASDRKCGLVELHRPLTALAKANSTHPFCGDRVHPGLDGHIIIAAHILDAMGYSPIVARAVVSAKDAAFVGISKSGSRNCRVTAIRGLTNGVAFTYVPKSLPLPKTSDYLAAEAFYPMTRRFNQELLLVRGLPAGVYEVRFDGERILEATATELEKGVNMALLNTPNQRRAMLASEKADRLRVLVQQLRRYQLVINMIRGKNIDANDFVAADAYLDGWLKSQESNSHYKSFLAWITSYRALRGDPLRRALDEVEDLREALNAVRPVISRVTVVRK